MYRRAVAEVLLDSISVWMRDGGGVQGIRGVAVPLMSLAWSGTTVSESGSIRPETYLVP